MYSTYLAGGYICALRVRARIAILVIVKMERRLRLKTSHKMTTLDKKKKLTPNTVSALIAPYSSRVEEDWRWTAFRLRLLCPILLLFQLHTSCYVQLEDLQSIRIKDSAFLAYDGKDVPLWRSHVTKNEASKIRVNFTSVDLTCISDSAREGKRKGKKKKINITWS
jgi:hypothetical protein